MDHSSRVREVSIELDLTSIVDDSPQFRATLQRNEDELEELANILETLVKCSRSSLEHAAKLAESLGRLAPSINRMTQLLVFEPDRTPTCLQSIIEFVESLFVLQERLVRDLGQRLLTPMIQSVQDDLKAIRDQRRIQDKLCDKYDALTAKYGSLPKLKEYALVREDTFQLFQGRQQYYEQLLVYVNRIERFRKGADLFFVDKCLGTMETLRDFSSAFGALVEALMGPAQRMRVFWNEWQREMKQNAARVEEETALVLQAVRNRFNPDAPYIASGDGVSKRGYLYRRKRRQIAGLVSSSGGVIGGGGNIGGTVSGGGSGGGSSGGGSGWKRVWLVLNASSPSDNLPDCMLSEWSMSKRRGFVDCNYDVHVLLCEVRSWEGEHRRHCFEVATSQRSLIYQAETEEEMRDWLHVFENAKAFALQRDQHKPGGPYETSENNSSIASALGRNITNATTTSMATTALTMAPFPTTLSERLPVGAAGETIMTSLQCLWTLKKVTPMTLSTGAGEESIGAGVGAGVWNFGKLLGTEASLCLQSTSFGQPVEAQYLWKEITQLEFKIQELTGVLTVTVEEHEDIASTSASTSPPKDVTIVKIRTINDEGENIEVLKMLWKNARSPQPRNAALLKRSLRDVFVTPSNNKSVGELDPASVGGERRATSPARCYCQGHLERLEYDAVIPISSKELVELMFGENSPIFVRLGERRKYKDFPLLPPLTPMTDTADEEPNLVKKRRTIKFIIPVNHPLVRVKETECFETQTLQYLKEPEPTDSLDGNWYSILQEARTPAVIYGDVFVTQCLFCLTNLPPDPWEDDQEGQTRLRTRLKIFIGVRFVKTPFVKSMIRSSTLKGLTEYVIDYVACLWAELRHQNPEMIEERMKEGEEEGLKDVTQVSTVPEATGTMAVEGALAYRGVKALAYTVKSLWVQQASFIRSMITRSDRYNIGILLCSWVMLVISFILWWRTVTLPKDSLLPSKNLFASYKKRIQNEQKSPVNLVHYSHYNQQVMARRHQIDVAMEEIERTIRQLEEADRRLLHRQYAIWLADQLTQCYGKAHVVDQCQNLEKQWQQLLTLYTP